MKIAICDDDTKFTKEIEQLLSKDMRRRSIPFEVFKFSSGEEFLKSDELPYYDAVFMDVKLTGINGVKTATEFRKRNSEAALIFVSGLLEYAMYGYRLNTLRYIIKNKLTPEFEECMNALFAKEENLFEVHFQQDTFFLNIKDILFFESQGRTIYIYTQKKVYHYYDKMNNIEKRIKKDDFIRIHQSLLVNLQYVKDVKGYQALLYVRPPEREEDWLPVSRSKYPEAREKWMLFKGRIR